MGRLPHVAPSVLSLPSSQQGRKEDPSKHQNRKRRYGHVPGNYPLHVFVPIAKETLEDQGVVLEDIVDQCSVVEAEGDSVHMSLSRSVPLKTHQVQILIDAMQKEMKNVSSFDVSFAGWTTFSNETNSRHFISLLCSSNEHNVLALIQRVDAVFKRFRLEQYYPDPIPHVSIAWSHTCLKDQLQILKERYPNISISTQVNAICLFIGKKRFTIPLQ